MENEEWRGNSYNKENEGAGRDGNRNFNRGGDRPYRPSYNREGGYRPRFNANRDGNSYGDRPQRPRFNANRDGGSYGDRPQRPRFNANNDGNSYGDRPQRPRFNANREGGSYGDRPQRPRFNANRDGNSYGDRPQRPRISRDGDSYRPRFNNAEGGDFRSNNAGGFRPRFNNDRQGGFRPRQRTADYNPNAKYSVKKQIEYKEQFADPNEPIRLNKFLAYPFESAGELFNPSQIDPSWKVQSMISSNNFAMAMASVGGSALKVLEFTSSTEESVAGVIMKVKS